MEEKTTEQKSDVEELSLMMTEFLAALGHHTGWRPFMRRDIEHWAWLQGISSSTLTGRLRLLFRTYKVLSGAPNPWHLEYSYVMENVPEVCRRPRQDKVKAKAKAAAARAKKFPRLRLLRPNGRFAA